MIYDTNLSAFIVLSAQTYRPGVGCTWIVEKVQKSICTRLVIKYLRPTSIYSR